MNDYGVKTFMNKLWSKAAGKKITGQTIGGEWFTGTVTNVRTMYGIDLQIQVEKDDGDIELVSGLDAAKGERFLTIEGL